MTTKRLPLFWKEGVNLWLDSRDRSERFTIPDMVKAIFNLPEVTPRGGNTLKAYLLSKGYTGTATIKGFKRVYNRETGNVPPYTDNTNFEYSERLLAEPPEPPEPAPRPTRIKKLKATRKLIPRDWQEATAHHMKSLKHGEVFTLPDFIQTFEYFKGLEGNKVFKRTLMQHLIFTGTQVKARHSFFGALDWLNEREIRERAMTYGRGIQYRDTLKFRKPPKASSDEREDYGHDLEIDLSDLI